jgi:hypothetical protein
MTRPTSALTKFILSQPNDLSPKEIIARAKAKGMAVSKSNVSRVRSRASAQATTPKPAVPAPPSNPAPSPSPTPQSNAISKSQFIRNQPATMSASEIVAKAKAAGIRFAETYVYNIRGRSTAKPHAKKPAAPPSRAERSGSPSEKKRKKAPATMNKADFIRERRALSPRQIVAEALAAGFKLDYHYVYYIRGIDKPSADEAPAPTGVAVPKASAPSVAPTTTDQLEGLLMATAAELGLRRAVEILEEQRAMVRGVMSPPTT